MNKGRIAEYEWLEVVESDRHNLSILIQHCPEVFDEKCLVISAFDSGPLLATSEELERGWEQHGDLVIIPGGSNAGALPFDNYDEWYVFPTYSKPKISEVFVNDGIFMLASPQTLIDNARASMGKHADIVGAAYRADRLRERQRLFWQQMQESQPESYISSGYMLTFVSNNPSLFETVLRTFRKYEI